MNTLRISCPGAECTKEERIRGLLDSCFDWASSEPLQKLVGLFGGNVPSFGSKSERLRYLEALRAFAARWDYRNGRERWAIEEDSIVTDNSAFVIEQIRALGLLDVLPPRSEPDYIIALGGARRTNHIRCLMAKKLADTFGYSDKTITALSAMRPINEIERPYTDEYAPGAETEYDAICAALENVFALKEYTESKVNDPNIHLCSALRHYADRYKGSDIYSIAAPSRSPSRRANSSDCFEHLVSHFEVGQGARLLLVTSRLYVPFQYLMFIRQAVRNGFEIDCIGTNIGDNTPLISPTGFLQEIKGIIDAIWGLYREWY